MDQVSYNNTSYQVNAVMDSDAEHVEAHIQANKSTEISHSFVFIAMILPEQH